MCEMGGWLTWLCLCVGMGAFVGGEGGLGLGLGAPDPVPDPRARASVAIFGPAILLIDPVGDLDGLEERSIARM